MNVIGFNGSPRKKGWNTVTLVEEALKGASSAGAETEMIQLYDLKYSGCISCFSCKRLDRKADGVCAVQDDLTSVLERIRIADSLVIGTPVYYGAESAATRAFLERLFYPCLKYDKEMKSLFPRRIRTVLIYTMNATEELARQFGFDRTINMTRSVMERNFGACDLLVSSDTLQYPDYDRYESGMFNKEEKLRRHARVFPQDCRRAFELGVRAVTG